MRPVHDQSMPIDRLQALMQTPESRRANYAEMVSGFYTLVSEQFTSDWGESQHCGLFATPDTPVAEAVAALEALIIRAAGIRAGMRVLDAGCGVGGPARAVARATGARVIGIDLTERRVEQARAASVGSDVAHLVQFRQADAMALPFPKATFDVVYAFEMTSHAPEKAAVFAELARVLKPGGVLAGSDWFQADTLSADDQERYIEPICRLISVPNLASLAELRAILTGLEMTIDVVEDLAQRGDVTPNFAIVGGRAAADLAADVPLAPLARMMAEGGLALSEAYRAGAFLMGWWLARKPEGGSEFLVRSSESGVHSPSAAADARSNPGLRTPDEELAGVDRRQRGV